MKKIKINDKNNKQYFVKINESGLENKIVKNDRENWKIKFEIFDQQGMLGQGYFEINCRSSHRYSSKDMLEELINRGTMSLKDRIDNGDDVASVAFHFGEL